MKQERISNPRGAWLGATILSLVTGAAFTCGAFLVLLGGRWNGLFFIVIAIAFAGLCWKALPKDHELQLWVTGLTIALPLVFFLYEASQFRPTFM